MSAAEVYAPRTLEVEWRLWGKPILPTDHGIPRLSALPDINFLVRRPPNCDSAAPDSSCGSCTHPAYDMPQTNPEDAAKRRAAYLANAREMRKLAESAHAPELREGFMRLAVLYEELAEYVASGTESKDEPGSGSPS